MNLRSCEYCYYFSRENCPDKIFCYDKEDKPCFKLKPNVLPNIINRSTICGNNTIREISLKNLTVSKSNDFSSNPLNTVYI